MADFADGITRQGSLPTPDPVSAGAGSLQEIQNQLYQHHPELISAWQPLRDVRAQRRAVEWLLEQGLINDGAAHQFTTDHPDPGLP